MTKKTSNTVEGEGSNAKRARSISLDGILKIIRVGTAEEFKDLLTQGLISNINMTNERGETLLMVQCINHCLKGVKLLIEHGADVNITDGQGNSAFILACRYYKDYAKEECASIIKFLVTKGANMNVISEFSSPIRGYQRGSALFEACIVSRLDVVSLLLELGATVNDVDALLVACVLRNIDVVKLFMSHGADVNVSNNYGHTSLGIACHNGYNDLVDVLLDHGADMNLGSDVFNRTPFTLACINSRLSTAKLLLDRGADVNRDMGATLVLSCEYAQICVVRLLLERGANVNGTLRNGRFSPLMAAVCRKDRGMIDLLLEYGADINAEDGGSCALSIAASFEQRENVILLLERGADLYMADGVTPIAHSTSGLLTADPEIAALVEQYREVNKRANRAFKPLLK